jgi:regulatory protein YycI of two-component signal transduction system YycFG
MENFKKLSMYDETESKVSLGTEYQSELTQLKAENERLKANQLPDGYKVYKCTDCQKLNILYDNKEIRVGDCSECEHPLWN